MKRVQNLYLVIVMIGLVYVVLMNSCSQPPLTYDIAWQKRYGGAADDGGQSVLQTDDGGFVVAGWTFSYGVGSADVFLIKTDSLGDTLWTKTYGGIDSDRAYCVRQTVDGGYIVVGSTASFGSGAYDPYDVYLVKVDNNGNLLWQVHYDMYNSNEWGRCVDPTSDGGYVIAAETYYWGGGRIHVRRVSNDGNTIWLRFFEGGSAYSIQQTLEGGYIVAGVRDGIYLLKLGSNGDSLWARNYGQGVAYSVEQVMDGGYILAGYAQASQENAQDFCVIRTDTAGAVMWRETFGWGGTDEFNAIQQTSDGGFVVVGVTTAFHAGNWMKTLIMKMDASGNTQWTRTYGPGHEAYGYAIIETNEGDYIVTGCEYSYDTHSDDIFLVKIEPVVE